MVDYYKRFFDVFEDVVCDSVESDMAFTLTAGLDTRLIGGILSKNGFRLPCFSSVGTFFDDFVVNSVADKIGSDVIFFDNKDLMYDSIGCSGFNSVLTGIFFDEINGGFSGIFAKNEDRFSDAVCFGVNSRLKYLANYYRKRSVPRLVCPVVDEKVLDCLFSIPFQYRAAKKIQRVLLKRYFPDLYKIPYGNTCLDLRVPFIVHKAVFYVREKLEVLL
ncbi:MAG: hypothetical protein CW691_10645 [Candidatus Bathyarchaeum sp.]|nr:MAG: hypothetical protein CW691_10645 [Candidatus Bathyarchaeum sp.]